jgi:hypothetical protein
MTFVLAFAGMVATAHACSFEQSSAQPIVRGPALDPGNAEDCMGMARHIDTTSNACETHCVAGQQANGKAQIPAVPLALQPALRIQLAAPKSTASSTEVERRSKSSAPPAELRFARLLI